MRHNRVPPQPRTGQMHRSRLGRKLHKQSKTDYVPSPADAVARKAYFAYVNEGSRPGREVQHWLAAEAESIAERNLTRVHGFHN